MRDTDTTMMSNVISLGAAFKEAHGNFTSVWKNDIGIKEFLEICANNHIELKATYKGMSDE